MCSKHSFNTISKVFLRVCCSSNMTKSQQAKISSPYLLPNKTAIPKLHKEEITVTTVLPAFALALKLYSKTPNKNLSDFCTSVIMSALNIRIYLGCYIQVLSWKRCFIPALLTVVGHLIQTPQTIRRSSGW